MTKTVPSGPPTETGIFPLTANYVKHLNHIHNAYGNSGTWNIIPAYLNLENILTFGVFFSLSGV